jgi:hypothetical protein
MYLLKALEFAFGAFLVAFIAWQIVAPMLQGNKPFPAFRKGESDDKAAKHSKPHKGGK